MDNENVMTQLAGMLATAEAERKAAVAPYDARIKQLKAAIKSLNTFEDKSREINERPTEQVSTITPEDKE